jgi:hypothetical protein
VQSDNAGSCFSLRMQLGCSRLLSLPSPTPQLDRLALRAPDQHSNLEHGRRYLAPFSPHIALLPSTIDDATRDARSTPSSTRPLHAIVASPIHSYLLVLDGSLAASRFPAATTTRTRPTLDPAPWTPLPCSSPSLPPFTQPPTKPSTTEYKEAFALFDKRGTGAVPRETLGDLLRALGQNPTQAEVAEIVSSAPRDGELLFLLPILWLLPLPSALWCLRSFSGVLGFGAATVYGEWCGVG